MNQSVMCQSLCWSQLLHPSSHTVTLSKLYIWDHWFDDA